MFQILFFAGIVVAIMAIVIAVFLIVHERSNVVRQKEAADHFFNTQQRIVLPETTGRETARPRS